MAELPQNHLPLCAAELLQSAFRYALSLTHHPEDAEDLVHEAWMNLRESYGGVESRAVIHRRRAQSFHRSMSPPEDRPF